MLIVLIGTASAPNFPKATSFGLFFPDTSSVRACPVELKNFFDFRQATDFKNNSVRSANLGLKNSGKFRDDA